MKKYLHLLWLLPICFSCSWTESLSDDKSNEQTTKNAKFFHYDSLTIPAFFQQMASNHLIDYFSMDSSTYLTFCNSNALRSSDSTNLSKYFTIKILHDLFSAKSASNGSRGEILNIPYLWHWVEPNPRHTIYFTKNNKLLKDIKPPVEFSKYNSYADIDRTPFLFLSDLVNPTPKYYSESGDTFATFGWCSEREMAFVALLHTMNYEGKVEAVGNHSWSEFIVSMKQASGGSQDFIVKVDNTFNVVNWTIITKNALQSWRKKVGKSNFEIWYNQKAKSTIELNKIKNHLVAKAAMESIENRLVNYINSK